MCMAIPSKVIDIDGMTATVECFGQQRETSLLLMNEPVALGDFLLLQAGGFAFEKVDPEQAEKSLEYLKQVLAEDDAQTPATVSKQSDE